MATPTKNKKIIVTKKLKDLSNDPFFKKKNEKAAETLNRYGLPEAFLKKKS
jgi:hypothetical protein